MRDAQVAQFRSILWGVALSSGRLSGPWSRLSSWSLEASYWLVLAWVVAMWRDRPINDLLINLLESLSTLSNPLIDEGGWPVT